jgi:hypothetical protein
MRWPWKLAGMRGEMASAEAVKASGVLQQVRRQAAFLSDLWPRSILLAQSTF